MKLLHKIFWYCHKKKKMAGLRLEFADRKKYYSELVEIDRSQVADGA